MSRPFHLQPEDIDEALRYAAGLADEEICDTAFVLGQVEARLSTAIHKCGYVSNGREKLFDRITGFTGFFPKTQEKSC